MGERFYLGMLGVCIGAWFHEGLASLLVWTLFYGAAGAIVVGLALLAFLIFGTWAAK